ncbi:hypothetical protein N0V90_003564 [Kalmusia sp. IMI 367209]|nr:hypothetical protein N0V90_003564 [Kalmusia sp. IMI 367209]
MPECKWCATAPSKKNARYRSKKHSHLTNRCIFKNNHHNPDFPDWLKRDLSDKEKMVLNRALFEKVQEFREQMSWMSPEEKDELYHSYTESAVAGPEEDTERTDKDS